MSQKHRLICITKNGTNPAYEGARIGARRVAERLGCEIQHLFPSTPDDIDQQRELIEQAIAERPDAILVAPTHPTALNSTLQKIVDAGIPLAFMVSCAEGIEAGTFVTSDNYALGKEIAEYLFRHLNGTGNVAIIEGSANSPTSQPRTDGFLDALKEHPGINLVGRDYGNYQKDDAFLAMSKMLKAVPDIDGILSANDFMGMGIIDALEEAHQKSALVGVNAMPGAIKAIQGRKMLATAAYDAMKMACIATEAAIRMLSGKSVPKVIELPAEIVDARNCDLWDRPYEERPLPDWAAST
ncbi:sugar ABC transporter substrate-binding protein [Roseibium sp.]|uniref:sugar ABC transporter substrate-binding protein n=1 Tax=Roseibium sp. TaxID=1936156 RepID=UPI003A9719E4